MEPFEPIDSIDSVTGRYNSAYAEAKKREEELKGVKEEVEEEVKDEESLYQLRYFVIKVKDDNDMEVAMHYSTWSSTFLGNNLLNKAYKSHRHKGSIYLFFSKKSSGKFSGIAEMKSCVDFRATLGLFSDKNWKGSFEIEWHLKKEVPLGLFAEMKNMDGKPVPISKDTAEIHHDVGNEMMLDARSPGQQTNKQLNANAIYTSGNFEQSFAHRYSVGDKPINEQVATNANYTHGCNSEQNIGSNISGQQTGQQVGTSLNNSHGNFEQYFARSSSNDGQQYYRHGAGDYGRASFVDVSRQSQNNPPNGRQENLVFKTGFSRFFQGATLNPHEQFHFDSTGYIPDGHSVYSQGSRENYPHIPYQGNAGNWDNQSQTISYLPQIQINGQYGSGTNVGFNYIYTAFPSPPGYLDNNFHPESRSSYYQGENYSHGLQGGRHYQEPHQGAPYAHINLASSNNFDEGYTMGDYCSANDLPKLGEQHQQGHHQQ
ncbi:hypothetical protein RUND412_005117 [Rhizina undulata]